MRVLIALVAFCLIAVPVAAQQQEEPATLKMDGSPALADPGTPVTLHALTSYPEEYVGNRSIENVRIGETTRMRNESESLYNIDFTEIGGDTTEPFRFSLAPFVTADDRIGRFLIQNSSALSKLRARILFRFEVFSFESFRHERSMLDHGKPFYCANVYSVEIRDKAGKTVATVP